MVFLQRYETYLVPSFSCTRGTQSPGATQENSRKQQSSSAITDGLSTQYLSLSLSPLHARKFEKFLLNKVRALRACARSRSLAGEKACSARAEKKEADRKARTGVYRTSRSTPVSLHRPPHTVRYLQRYGPEILFIALSRVCATLGVFLDGYIDRKFVTESG